MLKLLYDIKAGFEDCYLTIKDETYDLSSMLELEKYGTLEYLEDIEECEDRTIDLDELKQEGDLEFYNTYKDDIPALLELLDENGTMEMLYSDSVLTISKLFFSHMLGGNPIKHFVPVWEPSNWRLEIDDERSSIHYLNALAAKQVCDTLKLTKQQLHYYVKTGQIRKELNPDKPNSFKYNRTDVYILQKKLEKKYDRYRG
jgi:hypothetical protein